MGADAPTSFACADGSYGPGIRSCTDSGGGSGVGGHLDTSTVGPQTYTVTAVSADGQSATARISYTVVPDRPTITISTPAKLARHTLGRVIRLRYECRDGAGGPGIVACAGTSANGSRLDTGTLGSHIITLTAWSRDDQMVTETLRYTVVRRALRARSG